MDHFLYFHIFSLSFRHNENLCSVFARFAITHVFTPSYSLKLLDQAKLKYEVDSIIVIVIIVIAIAISTDNMTLCIIAYSQRTERWSRSVRSSSSGRMRVALHTSKWRFIGCCFASLFVRMRLLDDCCPLGDHLTWDYPTVWENKSDKCFFDCSLFLIWFFLNCVVMLMLYFSLTTKKRNEQLCADQE